MTQANSTTRGLDPRMLRRATAIAGLIAWLLAGCSGQRLDDPDVRMSGADGQPIELWGACADKPELCEVW